MRTQALASVLSYPRIRDSLHAYLVGEQLPLELEPFLLPVLCDQLAADAGAVGIQWHVERSLATSDQESGRLIERALLDVLASVDMHGLAFELMPHPHYLKAS